MALDGTAIVGTDPILESSVPIYDAQQGLFWQQTWCGSEQGITNQVALLGLNAQTDANADQRWDIDASQAPMYRLTVLTPDYTNGQSSSQNKFELVHNKVELDLKEHRKARALGSAELEIIKSLLRDKATINEISFGSADSAILYNMLLKGSNKTLSWEWVFRHSITTSRRYGVLVSLANIAKVLTTAQLLTPSISGIIIPAGTLFSLSAIPSYADIVETVPSPGVGGGTVNHTYRWGWLKQPPDIEQLPSGKVVIRQEYWLNHWSLWEYPD